MKKQPFDYKLGIKIGHTSPMDTKPGVAAVAISLKKSIESDTKFYSFKDTNSIKNKFPRENTQEIICVGYKNDNDFKRVDPETFKKYRSCSNHYSELEKIINEDYDGKGKIKYLDADKYFDHLEKNSWKNTPENRIKFLLNEP